MEQPKTSEKLQILSMKEKIKSVVLDELEFENRNGS